MHTPTKFLCVALCSIGMMSAARFFEPTEIRSDIRWGEIRLNIEQCRDISDLERDWKPVLGVADERFSHQYLCGEVKVYLDVVVYYSQMPGKEAVSYSNQVVANSWVYRFDEELVHLAPDQQFRLRHEQLRDGVMIDAWKTYLIGNVAIAKDFTAKLQEAKQHILLENLPTAVASIAIQRSQDMPIQSALFESSANRLLCWYQKAVKS